MNKKIVIFPVSFALFVISFALSSFPSRYTRTRLHLPRLISLILFLLLSSFFLPVRPASAAPTTMNFQGRLLDSSGTPMPDGLYNMKFALYTVASGGASTWTETRETTNRVQVTNGLFTTQLGDVTPFSANLFSGNTVYFEITLPTPATSTCSTAACATWESPMTPRHKMATSAYAFNSETLDGLDSTAFGQLSSNNTWTGTNTIRLTNAGALVVQNASSIPVLTADTGAPKLQVGSNTADATVIYFMLDQYNQATDPASTTNGAMYYNTNMNKFRCYQGGWVDCIVNSSGFATTALDNLASTNITTALNRTAGNLTLQTASSGNIILNPVGTIELQKTTNVTGNLTTSGTVSLTGATAAVAATTAATNFTLDAGTTGQVQIGGASTGDILLGGGAAATGCTLTNSTGAFACNSTVTGTQLASTVATGTAPLTIASTTKVANLNSDTIDGIDSTAFGQLSSNNIWTGTNTVQLTSTNAFKVQNASSLAVLTTDTSSNTLQIGNSTTDATAVLLGLDSYNNGTDPTGFNGALYYNTSLNKFRCYQNGVWTDCISSGVSLSANNTWTGTNLFKLDSTTALQVQNAAGTSLLTTDTTNARVYVGPATGDTTGALFILGNKTNAGDPTGFEGAMYYNSSTKDFRCYSNGGWKNCNGLSYETVELKDEFISTRVNGVNDRVAQARNIGELNWICDSDAEISANNGNFGCAMNNITEDANHPGVNILRTNVTSSGWAANMTLSPVFTSSFDRMTYIVRTSANVTTRDRFFIGMVDDMSSNPGTGVSQPYSGVYFRYTGTTIETIVCNTTTCTNGTTATITDTGLTPAANTWYRFEIRRNASNNYEFYINDTLYATSPSTYQPAAPQQPMIEIKNRTTQEAMIYIDYFSMRTRSITR